MQYRYRGSQRRLMLGEYPTLSLAKARDESKLRVPKSEQSRSRGERHAARELPTDTVAALVKGYVPKHVRVAPAKSSDPRKNL